MTSKFAKSYSSVATPLRLKLREFSLLFTLLSQKGYASREITRIFDDFAEYDSLLRRYTPTTLADARVFEIGFGSRPNRLIGLLSIGVEATGIDLDMPVLRGSATEFWQILRRNGSERALKSFMRYFLFDRVERALLETKLNDRGVTVLMPECAFISDDVTEIDYPDSSLDLVISEDVFEHIPAQSLEALVTKISRWLKPTGLALIRPNVFTGITGGHLAEWFSDALPMQRLRRRSEPWEHLRKNRFIPNVYLNRLSRSQFREVFLKRFEILDEVVREPDLGRSFLTGGVRHELRAYSYDELFSNQVMFVLKCSSPKGAILRLEH